MRASEFFMAALTAALTSFIFLYFNTHFAAVPPPTPATLASEKRDVTLPPVEYDEKADLSVYDMSKLLLHTRGLSGKQLISAIHKVNAYENHFLLDDALSVLVDGKDTIRTKLIPLTIEQAREFCLCFKSRACYQQSNILRDLTKQIAEIMAENFPRGAFVKISTASGKDAVGEKHPKFREHWSAYLNSNEYQVEKAKNITWEMNYRVCALTNVHQQILKVDSAEEAMLQLLMSKKVQYHLNAALIFPETFKKSIVIREWVDLGAEEEFRGFVVDNRLVAVSQFSYFCYNETLVKHEKKIEKAIITFFNQTVAPKFAKLPKVPSTYMIDFVVRDWEAPNPEVMVLEVGGISVYQGLFSRKKDKAIFAGKRPYELRVLHKMNVLSELKRNIPEWIPFIVEGLNLPQETNE